ncbi:UNVERIFIED_CONTAM: hypothetical protein Sradi_5275100 [Sesamum radiatum]|uniref:Endonuclease/exonuclease/phosphatase domain-containing protein n=1 Tax=Sesamum radiatum TaxID=300843 RepID=A0AAW2LPN5_SESRA
MILLVWNCQGLGSPWTVCVLNELIRRHNPGLVFLSETKCKKRKCDALKERHNLFGISVDSIGKGGGLTLLWRKEVNVVIQSFSNSHIDAVVSDESGTNGWRFTGVYGQPEAARRAETWNLLRFLSRASVRPWLYAGDFNEILSQSEKTGAPRPQRQIHEFRSCLSDCQLADLGFSGQSFTWCNQREYPYTVRVRLDRACATLGWQSMFPTAQVVTKRARGSDHNPLVINLEAAASQNCKRRREMFRFEAMWARSPECETIIQQLWDREVQGDSGMRIQQRTRLVRQGLIVWAKRALGISAAGSRN